MKLGEKLNLTIKQKGMTINQVAIAAKVPQSSLYSIIQRNSTKVDIDSFIRICNVLVCKPEDFAEEILEASDNITDLTKEEKMLLDGYRSLNDEGKERLLETAFDMTQIDRYKKSHEHKMDQKEA